LLSVFEKVFLRGPNVLILKGLLALSSVMAAGFGWGKEPRLTGKWLKELTADSFLSAGEADCRIQKAITRRWSKTDEHFGEFRKIENKKIDSKVSPG
jgi:hypothetical protein